MPRTFSFVDNRGECIVFGPLRFACDRYEKDWHEVHNKPRNKHLTLFDVLCWVALAEAGEKVERVAEKAEKNGDPYFAGLLRMLVKETNLENFGSSDCIPKN